MWCNISKGTPVELGMPDQISGRGLKNFEINVQDVFPTVKKEVRANEHQSIGPVDFHKTNWGGSVQTLQGEGHNWTDMHDDGYYSRVQQMNTSFADTNSMIRIPPTTIVKAAHCNPNSVRYSEARQKILEARQTMSHAQKTATGGLSRQRSTGSRPSSALSRPSSATSLQSSVRRPTSASRASTVATGTTLNGVDVRPRYPDSVYPNDSMPRVPGKLMAGTQEWHLLTLPGRPGTALNKAKKLFEKWEASQQEILEDRLAGYEEPRAQGRPYSAPGNSRKARPRTASNSQRCSSGATRRPPSAGARSVGEGGKFYAGVYTWRTDLSAGTASTDVKSTERAMQPLEESVMERLSKYLVPGKAEGFPLQMSGDHSPSAQSVVEEREKKVRSVRTMMAVVQWLQTMGLAHYAEAFLLRGVTDLESASRLTFGDLDSMGISVMHDRHRILHASSELGNELDRVKASVLRQPGDASSAQTRLGKLDIARQSSLLQMMKSGSSKSIAS